APMSAPDRLLYLSALRVLRRPHSPSPHHGPRSEGLPVRFAPTCFGPVGPTRAATARREGGAWANSSSLPLLNRPPGVGFRRLNHRRTGHPRTAITWGGRPVGWPPEAAVLGRVRALRGPACRLTVLGAGPASALAAVENVATVPRNL